jgi:hypothetical protein
MQLLVVIVNYRTAELVVDCLRSLTDEVAALPGTRVVVADNGSGDGSAERISEAIVEQGAGAWAQVLALEENVGFARGNNQAIAPALAEKQPPTYVLLLNPDTVVRPGAIEKLVAFLDAHPEAGIAGSRLEYPDRTPQRSAFRFHTAASEFEGAIRLGPVSRLLERKLVAPPVVDESIPTDWVAGASMLVRREVFDDVGLFDEGYFLYYEEMDFCMAAQRAGWTCWYVPDSHVIHLVGQASGVTDPYAKPKRRPPYWFDARRRFFVKNYGGGHAALADAAWMAGYWLWNMRRVLERRPNTDPPYLFRDFLRHSIFLKGARL